MKSITCRLPIIVIAATLALIAISAFSANAQLPQLINYQAVARNSSGSIIASQPVGVRLTIHDGSASGTTQYQETQTLTTNAYGLFSLQVGGGSVITGNISAVTWGSGIKYLQVEIDPTGGTSYMSMGTQQLVTVPYAFYAEQAASAAVFTGTVTMGGDVTGTNAATTVTKIQGKPISITAPTTGQGLVWNGTLWVPTTLAAGTTYTAGTGINIAGSVISALNTTALWNANELQGQSVSATVPTSGQVLTWSGTAWTPTTGSASSGWGLTGNAGTVPGTNFLGTTDVEPLLFRVDNIWAGEINSTSFNTSLGYQSDLAVTTGTYNTAIGYQSLATNTTGSGNTAAGGDALYTNSTGSNNTAYGYQSLENNTTGGNNTATGKGSLHTNTTGIDNVGNGSYTLNSNTTGSYNVATGSNALFTNTSGGYNTANGYNALYFNTTGLNNVANGYEALYYNTTGIYNTANGYDALQYNTTGNNNTADGGYALTYNTTGANNVAMGANALNSNTTGGDNTAIGFASMINSTTGIQNTATGSHSMNNNVTGSNNTAQGYYALHYNTTGATNTASGAYSLSENTTGSQNTASGDSSLTNNTTGGDNTATGFDALQDNTVGTANTAAGSHALLSNTTGGSNTANGYGALLANTTASDNTAEGYEALNANTTGSGNTATGYEALLANTTSTSNTAFGAFALGTTTGGANTGLGYNAYPSTVTLTNWTGIGFNCGGAASTSNSVELGNTSITVIRAQVTGITAISDRRIKDNVKENVPGLNFITKLRPVTYNLNIHRQNEILYKGKKEADKQWEGKYDLEKKTMSGFIAQEVDQAAKDAGYDFCGIERPATPDGLYGVRYTDFIIPIVKSVQELNAQNEAQQKIIKSQSQKINAMQKQLDYLTKRIEDISAKK